MKNEKSDIIIGEGKVDIVVTVTGYEDGVIKKIGAKLKKLRKEAGYKNYENFAFENDLNRVQYGRMESGTNFTIKSLLKILNVHQMPLKEFFKDI